MVCSEGTVPFPTVVLEEGAWRMVLPAGALALPVAVPCSGTPWLARTSSRMPRLSAPLPALRCTQNSSMVHAIAAATRHTLSAPGHGVSDGVV